MKIHMLSLLFTTAEVAKAAATPCKRLSQIMSSPTSKDQIPNNEGNRPNYNGVCLCVAAHTAADNTHQLKENVRNIDDGLRSA
ncbi:hypothetical protein D3C73_1129410 [compost metagenome]